MRRYFRRRAMRREKKQVEADSDANSTAVPSQNVLQKSSDDDFC